MTEWKAIPSFPQYEASSDGDIRRIKTGRVLRPTVSSPAYYVVGLYKAKDPKVYCKRVHLLVAEAFLGPRPEGLFILHGPNGALDNSVSNLSYGTQRQNLLDRRRDGTSPTGSANPQSKLTESDIPVIRRRALSERYIDIANDYGCSKSAIGLVAVGKTWTHA